MTNGQKILVAALGGAAVGLITGILFAPDKGSATRQRIADKAGNVSDSVKEFASNTSDAINSMKQKLLRKKDEVFQGDEAAAG
jgi:gas vesicle protein